MSRPMMIDAFCGAGGLSIGFQSHFDPILAIEKGKTESSTFAKNHPETDVRHDSVENVLLGSLPDNIDLLIGGPPCQAFSIANNSEKRKIDERRNLWLDYFALAERCNATAFLMENVYVLLTRTEFKEIIRHAKKIGYDVRWGLLRAHYYGAATKRKRLFIFGKKGTIKNSWPPIPTHKKITPNESGSIFDDMKPFVTLRDVIQDLPIVALDEYRDQPPPLNLHFPYFHPKNDPFLKYVPPEGKWIDVDKKLLSNENPIDVSIIDQAHRFMTAYSRKKWDEPSNTLTTMFTNLLASNTSGHPTENRSLTLREGARVQGFPDEYHFCGKPGLIAKQIGNSVNVKMASVLAKWVYNELFS